MRRRTFLTALLLVLALAAPAVGADRGAAGGVGAGHAATASTTTTASTATTVEPGGQCAGRIVDRADHLTLVSVQGARFGDGAEKTPARLLAFGPQGELEWVYRSGAEHDVVWSYDVDPLPNGNAFVTATKRGSTVLFELDVQTGERVWTEELPFIDTHDADVLDEHRIAVAQMRNYDPESGTNEDRVVIYNRTTDEIEWEWRFDDHYGRDVGGNYSDDWTHLNDVDPVGEHGLLLSPRNFDQVILVNRTTGEIELRLGEDGNHSVLEKQHNPDYLESDDGQPTFLVADSENDRIVEYERAAAGWNRTWTAGNSSTLAWPRDADRLPNGNTLITDSRNNRVIEVTPAGEVVWEVYGPWLVYDAERFPIDGSNGPTTIDAGATGDVDLARASPPSGETLERCDEAIDDFEGGWGVDNGPPNQLSTAGAGDSPDRADHGGEAGRSSDGDTDGGDANGTDGNGSPALGSEFAAGPSGGVIAGALLALLVVGAAFRAVRW